MAVFSAIYFIRNNAGTYEAYDSEQALVYSGTLLVTNVLNPIEAAHVAGDFAVFFGIGTFDMGTENWTLNDRHDVLIEGLGMNATRIINNSSAAADTEPFSLGNNDRVTLRDMEIAAGGAVRTTSDALDFDGGSDCLVERVYISDSRGRGIIFDGKDGTNVARGHTVRNCVVTNTRGGASQAGAGISLLATDRCNIEGCRVFGTTGPGIHIWKAPPTSPQANKKSLYNVIRGNTIDDAGTNGISILASDFNKIVDNIIINSGDDVSTGDGINIDVADAITAAKNVIRDNIIVDDQATKTMRYGINLNNATIEDTIVEGNSVDGSVTGAFRDISTRARVRDNRGIPDNTAQEVATAATLLADDLRKVINVDTSGAAAAITLPDNAAAKGRSFIIHRDGASAVTINRVGTNTFEDGATAKTLGSDGASIHICSIGDGEWKILDTRGTVT